MGARGGLSSQSERRSSFARECDWVEAGRGAGGGTLGAEPVPSGRGYAPGVPRRSCDGWGHGGRRPADFGVRGSGGTGRAHSPRDADAQGLALTCAPPQVRCPPGGGGVSGPRVCGLQGAVRAAGGRADGSGSSGAARGGHRSAGRWPWCVRIWVDGGWRRGARRSLMASSSRRPRVRGRIPAAVGRPSPGVALPGSRALRRRLRHRAAGAGRRPAPAA